MFPLDKSRIQAPRRRIWMLWSIICGQHPTDHGNSTGREAGTTPGTTEGTLLWYPWTLTFKKLVFPVFPNFYAFTAFFFLWHNLQADLLVFWLVGRRTWHSLAQSQQRLKLLKHGVKNMTLEGAEFIPGSHTLLPFSEKLQQQEKTNAGKCMEKNRMPNSCLKAPCLGWGQLQWQNTMMEQVDLLWHRHDFSSKLTFFSPTDRTTKTKQTTHKSNSKPAILEKTE